MHDDIRALRRLPSRLSWSAGLAEPARWRLARATIWLALVAATVGFWIWLIGVAINAAV